MAGDEAERARGQADRDIAIVMLVVEHGAVELERGIWPEREVGAVGHHQSRGALEAGAHRLVAQQRIADIDRRGCSRDAENFVLHHRRFADATLRLSGMGRQYDGKTDCW